MPIRTGTIPEAIPNPEKKPRKRRQNNKNQIGQSHLFPNPPENDEQDDACMEYKKENIQKIIHVIFLTARTKEEKSGIKEK